MALLSGLPALATSVRVEGSTSGPTILVVGDSLSAEYGLTRGRGWVALLEQRWRRPGPGAHVVNASISGDTTAGGRSRLAPLLAQHKPQIVVIELGANDALRGLPLADSRANLVAMAKASRAIGARVLIVGMQLPPNYGRGYGTSSRNCSRASRPRRTPGSCRSCSRVSPMCPITRRASSRTACTRTKAQHPIILANIWPALEKLLGP